LKESKSEKWEEYDERWRKEFKSLETTFKELQPFFDFSNRYESAALEWISIKNQKNGGPGKKQKEEKKTEGAEEGLLLVKLLREWQKSSSDSGLSLKEFCSQWQLLFCRHKERPNLLQFFRVREDEERVQALLLKGKAEPKGKEEVKAEESKQQHKKEKGKEEKEGAAAVAAEVRRRVQEEANQLILDQQAAFSVVARGFPPPLDCRQEGAEKHVDFDKEGVQVLQLLDGIFCMLYFHQDKWFVASKRSPYAEQSPKDFAAAVRADPYSSLLHELFRGPATCAQELFYFQNKPKWKSIWKKFLKQAKIDLSSTSLFFGPKNLLNHDWPKIQ